MVAVNVNACTLSLVMAIGFVSYENVRLDVHGAQQALATCLLDPFKCVHAG